MPDVPSLHLDDQAPTSPSGTSFRERTAENTLANAGRQQPFPSSPSGSPSVLRTPVRSSSSDRGSRRPSFSTTRSGSSSRSTSFSLPPEDLGRTEFREGGLGLLRDENDTAVEDEEALDAESKLLLSVHCYSRAYHLRHIHPSFAETRRVPKSSWKTLFQRGRSNEGTL